MERKRDEDDIRRELQSHLELEAEERRAAGLAEAEAREAARRAFGNVTQAQEAARGVWVRHRWEALWQDLRFGLRMIAKSPGFSAIAILTLALGIGANAVIYSLVSGVLLSPLAYKDPQRLVTVLHDGRAPIPPADFLDWQKQAASVEGLSAAGAWSATITGGDRPDQLVGLQMASGMFDLLGVTPLLGRLPSREEFSSGKDRVVVLGYGLWQRSFGGDAGIVGKSLNINGSAHTVIGVMPANFRFAPFWVTQAEIWTPLSLEGREGDRNGSFLRVFGRLKPGVSIAQAQMEITEIARRLEEAYPESNRGRTPRVDALLEKVVGNVRPALLMLLGAVGFVLLIACTNIANLALARGSERRKEIAVRLALGAARGRVMAQFLTENVVLALVGGGLGLALAYWGLDVLKVLVGTRVPRIEEMVLDRGVVLFTGGLSVLTGVLFGLIPAVQAAREQAGSVLKEGVRGTSQDQGSLSWRNTLIVAQVAISLVLLTGAGLLMRSFVKLRSIDPGFDVTNVLTARISLVGQKSYVGEAREGFYRNLEASLRSQPGVEAVSMTNHLPLAGDNWGTRVYAEGQAVPAPESVLRATYRVSRPGYFAAMRIRFLDGQDFGPQDRTGTPLVVVINERLAKRLWPGERVVGKRVSLDDPRREPHWRTVVGVIGDVKESSWESAPEPEVYLPFLQADDFLNGRPPHTASMSVVMRTSVDPLTMIKPLQSAVWAINRDVPVTEVQSMEQVIGDKLWQARFQLTLLGSFAGFALVLAAMGIYGVMAYAVVRRRQEIGIRMALGARQAEVVWMVLAQGLRLVAAGIVVGLLMSLALTRFLATVLYQVPERDGVTFAVIPVVLGVVALVAGYLPARRASGIDPVVALRCDS